VLQVKGRRCRDGDKKDPIEAKTRLDAMTEKGKDRKALLNFVHKNEVRCDD